MPLFKGVFILRDGRPGVIPGRRHLIHENKTTSPLTTLTESVDFKTTTVTQAVRDKKHPDEGMKQNMI